MVGKLALRGQIFLVWLVCGGLQGEAMAPATQSLVLEPGWNAVYLEVDPADPALESVFADLPVDIVAAYQATARGAQFLVDPTADLRSAYGWKVWYAPHRGDHFLSTLYGVKGATPLLVHALTNTTLEVTGTVAPVQPQWTADAYNFVGFSVVDPGGPTFAEFFAGAAALAHDRIYRLQDGRWRKVTDPAATPMRAGEAFWIFCDGTTDYAGPLSMTTFSALGLMLSPEGGSSLTLRNTLPHPLQVTLAHQPEAEDAPVPMTCRITVLDEDNTVLRSAPAVLGGDAWTLPLPPLEAGEAIRLPLELDLSGADFGVRYSSLTATTDIGTKHTINVTAFGLQFEAATAGIDQ